MGRDGTGLYCDWDYDHVGTFCKIYGDSNILAAVAWEWKDRLYWSMCNE